MDVVDISTWASKSIRTINITQDVAGLAYEVKVRRFVPEPGDALARKWKTRGVEQAFHCEPYGIANMAEAGKTLAVFVDATINDQIGYYIDESDKLMRGTYMMAFRYSRIAEVRVTILHLHQFFNRMVNIPRGRRKNSSYDLHYASGARPVCRLGRTGSVAKTHWACCLKIMAQTVQIVGIFCCHQSSRRSWRLL